MVFQYKCSHRLRLSRQHHLVFLLPPLMALSLKLISFFFLFALFSIQIHARDSQFFSKVSATPTIAVNNNNYGQEKKTLPSKDATFNNQEQEPAFYPDTQNGYGLYGQESTRFPTTTKLTSSTYATPTYDPYKTQTQPQSYTGYPESKTNNNNYYYNDNQYDNNAFQERQGETSTQEAGYTTTSRGNNNRNMYYNGVNGYPDADEKQGMSDTRYLENGKYYYDIQSENNYNPNQFQRSRNNYNNARAYHGNDQNSNYAYQNSMQKYQNENESEESQEEQYVP